ncbi:hypothetical protein [Actinomadura flavalba]|uniref:hypothetical protein n=1 Tax=Actinomadura flavalba TaxID=1120938 RepID=UPI0003A97328|nr:hypothetical protein [Actinomadura flavalba]
MTAKTTRDAAGDDTPAEEVAAEQDAETAEAAPKAAPAKRKRRVRVIEVIEDDDDDLEEVLDALDAEEAAPAKPAAKAKAKAAKPAEVVEDEDDAEPEPVAAAPKPRPKPRSRPEPEPPSRTVFGLAVPAAVAIVVVVALLASLALWQWQRASSAASERDARGEVEKVALAYGNVAVNYSAGTYRAQIAKAEALMAGDLLEQYRQTTVPNLVKLFDQDKSQAAISSKAVQAFVGDVNERFATAVVQVDIQGGDGKTGTTEVPANLIRLALAKIDGSWKVTRQYASGQNDQTQTGGGGLPAIPNPSPSATVGEKPKD